MVIWWKRWMATNFHLYHNPPLDSSYSSSHVGTITSYVTPHAHQHVHGHACTRSYYSGVAMNPYYPFHGSPPISLAPIDIVLKASFFNLHLLLKDMRMHKKMYPSPPNKNNKNKNKGKGNQNDQCQTQGNQGNHN